MKKIIKLRIEKYFKVIVSICTLLTLIIVILDYLGLGKEFWKSSDPASIYAESEAKKNERYELVDEIVKSMEVEGETKIILRNGRKAIEFLQFHASENLTYALNVLKPEERYYSEEVKMLFYTSHPFEFNGNEHCKKVTVELPENLKVLEIEMPTTFCLVQGEWQGM